MARKNGIMELSIPSRMLWERIVNIHKKKPPAPPNIANVHEGDRAFMPFGTNTNKKEASMQGTFEVFPGEQKGAIRTVKRVVKDDTMEERPNFKPTNNHRAVIMPSIATNVRNLK